MFKPLDANELVDCHKMCEVMVKPAMSQIAIRRLLATIRERDQVIDELRLRIQELKGEPVAERRFSLG